MAKERNFYFILTISLFLILSATNIITYNLLFSQTTQSSSERLIASVSNISSFGKAQSLGSMATDRAVENPMGRIELGCIEDIKNGSTIESMWSMLQIEGKFCYEKQNHKPHNTSIVNQTTGLSIAIFEDGEENLVFTEFMELERGVNHIQIRSILGKDFGQTKSITIQLISKNSEKI